MKSLLRTTKIGALALALALPSLALAAAPPGQAVTAAPATRESPPPLGTPRDFRLPEKTTYRLENGVGVTLVPFGTVPKATIMVVVRTGNVDDGAKNGLADMAADLMKEGAGSRTAADLARYAAEMGGGLDVGAGAEQFTVSIEVLAERAADAIGLAGDVLRRPTLPASELPRLKANFVRQLAVARSNPQSIARDAYARLLWGDHPYGRGLPTDADVASYTIDDVRSFVAQNFGAARTHVYVGGRFDRAAVDAAIRAAFGDWNAGAPPTVNPPSGATVAQVKLIDRPDAAQSTIVLGLPAIDPTRTDYLPLVVTNSLLGSGLLSRFNQNLREDKGWTYGVGASISPTYRSASWTTSTDVNTKDTAPAIRELFAEIARLQREAPPPDELQRVQNLRAGAFVIGASSRGGLLGQLAFLDLHGLPDSWLTDYVKHVYAVTPEQVSKAARDYLPPAKMTMVVVGDLKKIGGEVKAIPQVKAAAKR